jgi:hypothetical protein
VPSSHSPTGRIAFKKPSEAVFFTIIFFSFICSGLSHFLTISAVDPAVESVQATRPARDVMVTATIQQLKTQIDARRDEVTTYETRYEKVEKELRASQRKVDGRIQELSVATQHVASLRATLHEICRPVQGGHGMTPFQSVKEMQTDAVPSLDTQTERCKAPLMHDSVNLHVKLTQKLGRRRWSTARIAAMGRGSDRAYVTRRMRPSPEWT